jgi:hypothetical protein
LRDIRGERVDLFVFVCWFKEIEKRKRVIASWEQGGKERPGKVMDHGSGIHFLVAMRDNK